MNWEFGINIYILLVEKSVVFLGGIFLGGLTYIHYWN